MPTDPCLPTLPPLLAGFPDVFQIVVGVVITLTGLGLFLMGLISVADGSLRRGGAAAGIGAGLIALGMWLVGVFA